MCVAERERVREGRERERVMAGRDAVEGEEGEEEEVAAEMMEEISKEARIVREVGWSMKWRGG